MDWTTTKPTEPGWYWFRVNGVTRIVEVYNSTRVGNRLAVFLSTSHRPPAYSYPWLSMVDGEWQPVQSPVPGGQ